MLARQATKDSTHSEQERDGRLLVMVRVTPVKGASYPAGLGVVVDPQLARWINEVVGSSSHPDSET
jgi:hypothetical protein